jgi:primosomal protein N' (replication factor Y)
MNYYEVAPTQIARAGSDCFTYSCEQPLSIGHIVKIEIGKKLVNGVVVMQVTKPEYATKPITGIIEDRPLPRQLVDLSLWMSKYYAVPLATVLQSILPRGIDKKRRIAKSTAAITKRERTNIVFNKDQSKVLKTLSNYNYGTFLLQGVTGSGKTAIYIETTIQSIKSGKSVIIIVPEIALTSQLISEFSNHFDSVMVTHSKMTEASRHNIWTEALHSNNPQVVIGPRSTLFTPLASIGAIIIDEAHEPSLKQEQSPKYSALRAATILGRLHNAKVIFGSATPSIVDRYLADQSDKPILKLDKVARPDSATPSITLVDMKQRSNFPNHRFLSRQLLASIEQTLSQNKQVLVFHNRRGSTSTTMCEQCGWSLVCTKCHTPLTLHSDKHQMICHICGLSTSVPTHCAECSSVNIIHKGIGTKLIESELKKAFPSANIVRFDADNKTNETVNAKYDELYNGKINIAIGTQVVAKGLDLPHLRTVCIIQADSGLSLPDFSTHERIFQLIAQVVGRVGRNEHKTQVIIQTYQPTHPSIINGIAQNYESFYSSSLEERRKNLFPPFSHLLQLTCVYKTEATAISSSKKLSQNLRTRLNKDVKILGPAPAFYERIGNTYRWQLILKGSKREHLFEAIKLLPNKNWQFELDPTSLI